jgi:hypothetical protein
MSVHSLLEFGRDISAKASRGYRGFPLARKVAKAKFDVNEALSFGALPRECLLPLTRTACNRGVEVAAAGEL